VAAATGTEPDRDTPDRAPDDFEASGDSAATTTPARADEAALDDDGAAPSAASGNASAADASESSAPAAGASRSCFAAVPAGRAGVARPLLARLLLGARLPADPRVSAPAEVLRADPADEPSASSAAATAA